MKRETRFASHTPANEIMSKIEETAKPLGFNVDKRNYKVIILNFNTMARVFVYPDGFLFHYHLFFDFISLQMKLKGDKSGRKGELSVATEVMT